MTSKHQRQGIPEPKLNLSVVHCIRLSKKENQPSDKEAASFCPRILHKRDAIRNFLTVPTIMT